MSKPYLSLSPSEQTVTQAAARIYAAYIVSGRVTKGSEDKWREQAVQEAVQIAQAVDTAVQADDEMG